MIIIWCTVLSTGKLSLIIGCRIYISSACWALSSKKHTLDFILQKIQIELRISKIHIGFRPQRNTNWTLSTEKHTSDFALQKIYIHIGFRSPMNTTLSTRKRKSGFVHRKIHGGICPKKTLARLRSLPIICFNLHLQTGRITFLPPLQNGIIFQGTITWSIKWS